MKVQVIAEDVIHGPHNVHTLSFLGRGLKTRPSLAPQNKFATQKDILLIVIAGNSSPVPVVSSQLVKRGLRGGEGGGGGPYPLLCPLKSSVMPKKLPSPWLPGFFRSAHRLPSAHPIHRNWTNSNAAAAGKSFLVVRHGFLQHFSRDIPVTLCCGTRRSACLPQVSRLSAYEPCAISRIAR